MDADWFLFLSTLLATFLGVGLAFLLNHLYNNQLEKTKAVRLLSLLKYEIKNNYDLLLELEREFKMQNYTPFYDLTFVVWNYIPSNIIILLKKANIMIDIYKFYYELQHIERKINRVFELSFNPEITKESTLLVRQQLVDSLNIHLPGVLMGKNCKSPQTIITEIEYLIKELR